jgi:azurin
MIRRDEYARQPDAMAEEKGAPLDAALYEQMARTDMNVNVPGSAPLTRRQLLFLGSALLWFLMGCGHRPKPEQKVVDLHIASDGDFLAFIPNTLTCPAGALVRLTFHHSGEILSARHNWVLLHPRQLEAVTKDSLENDGILSKDDPRVIAATPTCDKGETVVTQFIAPPSGEYPFLCSTHPEDMRGILHVTK